MQANSGNIILIGMPGSGKSTCGVVAAKLLLKNFFDTDLLIRHLQTMCRRIQNLDSRGVVLQAGYTLQDMYKERLPLYRRYADAVIKCDNNTVEQTAQQIARCAR